MSAVRAGYLHNPSLKCNNNIFSNIHYPFGAKMSEYLENSKSGHNREDIPID